jgi:hypothetical protein
MAIGNMVGRTIKFEDWKGDARSGRVLSILDNGDYEVSTDSGMALVSNDEIIKMRKGGYVPKSKKLTARQQAKLEKVLHEFKMGELHSGSKTGPIVKSRKQALAIGLAEARSTKMAQGGGVGKKLIVGKEDFSFLLDMTDKELSKRLDLVRKQQEINGKQYLDAFNKKENTKKIEEAGERLANQERAIIQARIKVNKMAQGGEVGDVKTYKLRAEGLNDFLAFLQQGMYMKIKSFTVEPIGIPDVVVTFITDSSLSEIKSKLKKVPDSHVMLETVKPINEYTGDRDGEEYAKGGEVDYFSKTKKGVKFLFKKF